VIYVIATLSVKREKLSTLLEAARAVIAATRKEDGCIFYDLHQSITDPDQLVFVERWESREALGKHFEQPHMTVWRAASGDCIASRKVEIVTAEHVETR
jgi:quinol monooxygenase YgiN